MASYRNEFPYLSYYQNLQGYQKSITGSMAEYRLLADNIIKKQAPTSTLEMSHMLDKFGNRVPLGRSPRRKEQQNCDAKSNRTERWDVIMTYVIDVDRLAIVDNFSNQYGFICWSENCGNRCYDVCPPGTSLMMCSSHRKSMSTTFSVSEYTTYGGKVAAVPAIQVRQSPYHILADVLDAFSKIRTQHAAQVQSRIISTCLTHWKQSAIEEIKDLLSSGEVFTDGRAHIALDGPSDRLMFTTKDLRVWKFKCEHIDSENTQGCFHETLSDSIKVCKCHATVEAYLILSKEYLLSIIGLTSSDNATDLDYRRIIGQIGPAGKLAAHENEVSFSTSDNEPWEIVVTIKLSNREEISTRKFFVCQGPHCGEWVESGKKCTECNDEMRICRSAVLYMDASDDSQMTDNSSVQSLPLQHDSAPEGYRCHSPDIHFTEEEMNEIQNLKSLF